MNISKVKRMTLLVDLPEDLHAPLAAFLPTEADVLALRATCCTFRNSSALLLPHPFLAAMCATVDLHHAHALQVALTTLARRTTHPKGLSARARVVQRLLRARIIDDPTWTTLRDAGFPAENAQEVAQALAAVALADRPDLVALVLALVLAPHRLPPPTIRSLWPKDSIGTMTRMLRLAKVHHSIASGSLSKVLADRAAPVAAALEAQFAPDINHTCSAFELVLKLECAEDRESLLAAVNGVRTVVARTLFLFWPWTRAFIIVANNITGNDHPNTDQMLECDVVPRIVTLLSHANTEIAREASWTICNLAAHTEESTTLVVDAGAMPPLLRHLRAKTPAQLRHQSVWSLGNIVADRFEYRDLAVDLGIVELLTAQVTRQTVALATPTTTAQSVANLAWVLRVVSSNWRERHNELLPLMVPALGCLLASSTAETVVDAARALHNLFTNTSDSVVQRTVELGGPAVIVEHLRRGIVMPSGQLADSSVFVASLNALKGLAQTSTFAIVDAGLIPVASHLLGHPAHSVVTGATVLLTRIVAASDVTDEHLRAVVVESKLHERAARVLDADDAMAGNLSLRAAVIEFLARCVTSANLALAADDVMARLSRNARMAPVLVTAFAHSSLDDSVVTAACQGLQQLAAFGGTSGVRRVRTAMAARFGNGWNCARHVVDRGVEVHDAVASLTAALDALQQQQPDHAAAAIGEDGLPAANAPPGANQLSLAAEHVNQNTLDGWADQQGLPNLEQLAL
ncbi:armadillo-type protein [Blastocladiella britannica]|nr:armadillo-type protein [Blastocladiella britannica]